MKPSQPHGAVESRVWYAHNLVVPEQHESESGKSALAAAARQALESTKALPRTKARPRHRTRWIVAMSLAGAAVAAMSVPWRQETSDYEAAVAHEQPSSAVAKELTEAVASDDQSSAVGSAEQAIAAAAPASAEALDEAASDERLPATGFTVIDTASLPTGAGASARDLRASEYAAAPPPIEGSTGVAVPSQSAPEVDVVELKESEAPLADDGDQDAQGSASRTASQTRSRKKPAGKQSVEYYETGDCAMPSWAWRVFGFTEPVIKKRGCGG